MEITYQSRHDFDKDTLQDLFLAVGWSSGHYPERLVQAMKGFQTVFSAWDGDVLAGLICAMDDGAMNAYLHYLLVRPAYQKAGIGRQLVERMKEHYKDYLRIVLVAYDRELDFYRACGFEPAAGASPMFLTSLWT